LSDNKKRIEVKVGTAYGSDPNKVIEQLLKAALAHDKVLKEPEPRPFFTGFGDSSLNFRLLFWVRFEDGLQTQSDVAINIYNLFKVNNIEIPFPQIDLHIRSGAES
jgi:small-conductance mechanosensitive channel